MRLISFLKSSVGKKVVMASSGLLLILFLVLHAFGNAAIYMGSKYFQRYADTLHGFPVLVLIFSVGLLVILAAHIAVGVALFIEKRRTGPAYKVQAQIVDNSFAMRTMPYTGLLVFVFLVIHVFSFGIGKPADVPISMLVQQRLSDFLYSLFYLVSFIALAIHLNHGFWSMLQTFGINHPRFDTLLARLTVAVPLAFLVIFGGIPIFFMTGTGAAY